MPGNPLKVLFLYDCIYPESVGGVEHRNHELAAALAARGHLVTLAGWTQGQGSPESKVAILPLGLRTSLYDKAGKRRVAAAIRFTAACARLDLSRYDVVETANIPYLHLFVLAARCRLLRVPLVVSWYEYWGAHWREYVGPWKAPVFRALERATVGLGRIAAPISSLTARRLLSRRLDRSSVRHLPGGVPVGRIREAARSAEPGPALVYAGRLHREKRLGLLIRALADLDPDEGTPVLTIIGDGPDRSRLERLAEELGVSRRVSFAGRLAGSREVWRALGGAKIAVQPSSREGFGLFPLEAMAAGLPVVYCESPESAVSEIVEDEVAGVCSPAEPAALSGVLNKLLRDPVRLERLSANASVRAREFDWESICDRLEQLLKEVSQGEDQ